MKRTACRICRSGWGELKPILSLGEHPPSNALHPQGRIQTVYYPLNLVQCVHCELLQLDFDVPPENIFDRSYPLHSSKGSREWLTHIESLCSYAQARFGLTKQSRVVEIGSNDGYLLRNFLGHCDVLGVDPSGIPAIVPTIMAPFGAGLAPRMPQADLVFAINTVAQIPDLGDFIEGLRLLLKPSGVAILEFPNLVTTINETQFDTIYHEHYSYLSVTALNSALHKVGLGIFDVERLRTHGGSLRVFVCHWQKGAREDDSVGWQIDAEMALDYAAFAQRVQQVRRDFLHFLTTVEFIGQKICAYGAAARGNTFLNYCLPGAAYVPIDCVADVNPEKIGKFLPGTELPVVSEAEMLARKPDYILILAWTWRHEAMKRLRELGYKGAFVVALPKLEVIE